MSTVEALRLSVIDWCYHIRPVNVSYVPALNIMRLHIEHTASLLYSPSYFPSINCDLMPVGVFIGRLYPGLKYILRLNTMPLSLTLSLTLSLSRLINVTIKFQLKAINIQTIINNEIPDCYTFYITVSVSCTHRAMGENLLLVFPF